MNSFWVEFTDGTTIGKIDAGLKAVPAIDPELQGDTWFLTRSGERPKRTSTTLRGELRRNPGGTAYRILDSRQTTKSARSSPNSECTKTERACISCFYHEASRTQVKADLDPKRFTAQYRHSSKIRAPGGIIAMASVRWSRPSSGWRSR